MIFYTADPHFGSESIIEHAARPFSSLREMDEELIRRWNDVVSDTDTVYLLGDVGSHCTPFPAEQITRLRGHKHLIRGNHDTVLEDQQSLFQFFESVSDLLEIEDGDTHITLCHYPLVYDQRGYMIHGHIHNTRKRIYQILTQLPRVLNAGVDINHFAPVTLEELIRNNQEYYHDPQRGCPAEHKSPRTKPKWEAVFHPLPTKP